MPPVVDRTDDVSTICASDNSLVQTTGLSLDQNMFLYRENRSIYALVLDQRIRQVVEASNVNAPLGELRSLSDVFWGLSRDRRLALTTLESLGEPSRVPESSVRQVHDLAYRLSLKHIELNARALSAAEVVQRLDLLSAAFHEKASILDSIAIGPFLIEAKFSPQTVSELITRLEYYVPRTEITRFLSNDLAQLDRVAFVGMYPSGAVRGLSVLCSNVRNQIHLRLADPLALLDPDGKVSLNSNGDVIEERISSAELFVVGLKTPPA